MMNAEKLKNIIEAALMAADGPLSVNQLQALFEQDPEQPDRAAIRQAVDQLTRDCDERGIELQEVAGGFRFQVREAYADWVNRLQQEKPPRYSRALLETLAIIAYRQPITRGEIEDIRGVSTSSNIIKTLQEREWIRVVGHRDVPGKPELLATTRQFLDYFNLKTLSDLPPLSEIKDFDKINPDLFDSIDNIDAEDPDQAAAATTSEAAAQEATVAAGTDDNDDTAAVVEEWPATETAAREQGITGEDGELSDSEMDEEQIHDRDNVVPFSN